MTTQNRRDFLTTIGAAAVGIASGCGPAANGEAVSTNRKLNRIGLQLYTVRNLMKDDLPGTLASVAAMGYKEVEFHDYFGRSPAEIRDLLARNGLTSPSTHISIESMRKEWPRMLDVARQIGQQWVIIPFLADQQRPGGLDGWKRLAAEFNNAARAAREAGLRFGYHNHDFELKQISAAGQTPSAIPLDILITETDPSLVDFEIDIYWVVKGGGDPLSYLARFGTRIPIIHVKDSAGPPLHAITEVGGGSIDFRRIFADADKAGVKHFFVEQDEPADPMASIRTSYNYLKSLEY